MIDIIRKLKPKYDLILSMSSEIDSWRNKYEMASTVYNYFEYLKPLSHKRVKVSDVSDSIELHVGHWLIRKYKFMRTPEVVKDCEEFFNCIRKYGDMVKGYVRDVIHEDFSKLVDLAKQLIPYDVFVNVNVPNIVMYTYEITNKRLEIREKTVNGISIKLTCPSYLYISTNDGKLEMYFGSNIIALEGLIEHVIELYKIAEKRKMEIEVNNNEILRKMGEVIEPYKIARALSK